jgi:hypothetical protein
VRLEPNVSRDLHLMREDDLQVEWRPRPGSNVIEVPHDHGTQRVYLYGRDKLVLSTIICPNPAAHRRRPSRARRIRRRLRTMLR